MAKWRLRLFWAFLLAVLTVWTAKSYLGALEETAPLIVTTREIPARTRITPDMIKVIEVKQADRDRIAADAFSSADQVLGRYSRHAITAGEILRDRPGDLTDREIRPAGYPGEGALAEFLPPGTRAVTVKTDREGVLGKHVQSGDRVDLVFTSKADSTGGVYASLVVQQVAVLHIERDPEMPDEVLVTLLVTAEQAVQISLAKRTGDLDLVLTPPDPGDPVQVRAVSPLVFTGQPGAPPLPAGKAASDEGNTAAAQPPRAKGQ
jgi:Flp pilus assembly protein CpaB